MIRNIDESFMIQTICTALKEDRVIPYYQGIHDNRQGTINKYEALIRIKCSDGKILFPNDFLDVAKRNGLYSDLTVRMIDKVLRDFNDTDCMVSINILGQDIYKKEVREHLLNRIDEYSKPSNIVFELLESEDFTDIHMIRYFVEEVRSRGSKIAIDDFGTGWSNFVRILQIQPDYIKVAGEIVKGVHTSTVNKNLLKIFALLAKEFDIELVAEFVENTAIQKQIREYNIPYSQGYLFAQPEPFENLRF